jgi:hypothetical protein
MKVTFDGVNKLIIINQDEDNIDVRADIYREWVNWSYLNTQFLYALRYTGGEPTYGGQLSGIIFFTINGWRISFDHSVAFTGSIFSDDYPTAFITPPGTFMGQSVVSSLVTQIPGTSISANDIDSIKDSIWNANIGSSLPNTAGAQVNILSMMNLLITELHKINGLDANHATTITKTSREVDSISQTFNIDSDGDVTITRN